MTRVPYVHPDDGGERAGLRDYMFRPDARRHHVRRDVGFILIFVLGFLAGYALRAEALGSDVVSLIARPQIMLQRGDVRIEVRVPRHADNRLLSLAWSSDHGTDGASVRPLEGDEAAALQTFSLTSQPAANYLFVATVFGAGGRPRGHAEARIVTPDDRDPERTSR